MMRCKEVATLLSTDELSHQSIRIRLALGLHLALCRHCRRFRKQLRMLGRAAESLGAGYDAEVEAGFVERLHQSLRR